MQKLTIETRNINDMMILDLKGILDINSKGVLIQNFKSMYDDNYSRFLLNFAMVTRIDSSGVNSIIEIYDTVEGKDKEIVLYNLAEHVGKILRFAQLHRFITIKRNETEAIS